MSNSSSLITSINNHENSINSGSTSTSPPALPFFSSSSDDDDSAWCAPAATIIDTWQDDEPTFVSSVTPIKTSVGTSFSFDPLSSSTSPASPNANTTSSSSSITLLSSPSSTLHTTPLSLLYDSVSTRYLSPTCSPSPQPLSEHSRSSPHHICPTTNEETCWYFAIGSMINPTSLALRKLTPIESYPGILHNWRLVFLGDCGMASVLPCDVPHRSLGNHHIERNNFHGVLHRLTKAQMTTLDVIENSYERLEVDIECYDGQTQRALVYKMLEEKLDPTKKDALPSERYIDIISRGCVHFGIAREYIEWLRSHACVKRKKVSEYKKIPIHELHQSGQKHLNLTAEELKKFDGGPILDRQEEEEYEQMLVENQSIVDDRHAKCCDEMIEITDFTSASSHSASTSIASSASSTGVSASSASSCNISPSTSLTECGSLLSNKKQQRSYPLRIAVNKRILEWIGDLSSPLLINTYDFIRYNFGGTDLTHSYTQVFFEPLYPIVGSYDEMSVEHRAMIEDIFAEKILHPNPHLREWKLVGFLSRDEQTRSQQVGRAKLKQNRMDFQRDNSAGDWRSRSKHRGDGDSTTTTNTIDVPSDLLDPHSSSNLLTYNMFLSLSLEDHSGASSTCFAYCCAGATPFAKQRRQRKEREIGGGAFGGAKSATNAVTTPLSPSSISSSAITTSSSSIVAVSSASNATTRLSSLTESQHHQRVREKQKNRRHSIGNVGLHQQMMNLGTCGKHESLKNGVSETKKEVQLAGALASPPVASFSAAELVSPKSPSASAASSSLSSTTAAAPPGVTRQRRSQSICNGQLRTLHPNHHHHHHATNQHPGEETATNEMR